MPTEELPYHLLPESLIGGMQRYIQDHIETGSFLRYVLEGDLYNAVTKADPDNRKRFVDIVLWIRFYAPDDCYGSEEAVSDWLALRHEAQK